jgi:hypothetical protein
VIDIGFGLLDLQDCIHEKGITIDFSFLDDFFPDDLPPGGSIEAASTDHLFTSLNGFCTKYKSLFIVNPNDL